MTCSQNAFLMAILTVAGVVCGTANAATDADIPVLKSGQWDVVQVTNQEQDKKRVTTMCLDETVQASMHDFGMGMAKDLCSQADRKSDGKRLTIDAVCKLGTTVMKSHSEMVFNGTTAYHTEAKATYDPKFMGMSESTTTLDGKWTGPCKPGQKPGDITLPGGQTINIKDIIKK